ncbi:phosphonoacetaldehyde hydrolase [Roseococcus sp. YIM B11640]|uniref:phosphonoacetaldehyde hydrolase n=1 Tax=Roseococcus sp. YIM B11640 TaxID=3133973 RepID=UPI003C7DC825
MIRAVILDWAGTVVDFGSRAPMAAFQEAFRRLGVEISIDDARGPMGMAKRDHIRLVGSAPHTNAAWKARHGHDFGEADIDAIFEVFEPLNVAAVEKPEHSSLIAGANASLDWCAGRGIRIGSTTGYTRPIMQRLAPLAAKQGFAPEVMVCAGDLAAGRPAPLQMWWAMATMGIWPASEVVKFDDTPPGIGEARNAGAWAVGFALSGNIAGLSEAEMAQASEDQKAEMRERATVQLIEAGAHLVVDSIADLPMAIADIEARMAEGESP